MARGPRPLLTHALQGGCCPVPVPHLFPSYSNFPLEVAKPLQEYSLLPSPLWPTEIFRELYFNIVPTVSLTKVAEQPQKR